MGRVVFCKILQDNGWLVYIVFSFFFNQTHIKLRLAFGQAQESAIAGFTERQVFHDVAVVARGSFPEYVVPGRSPKVEGAINLQLCGLVRFQSECSNKGAMSCQK